MSEIKTFKEAMENCKNPRRLKSIDGTFFDKNKICGYCSFGEHEGFLTERQKRIHNCENKNCPHFLPKINEGKVKKRNTSASFPDIADEINEALKDFEGMKVIKAEQSFNGKWLVSYITISNYDEEILKDEIYKNCNIEAVLKKLPYSFSNAAEIIFKGR